MISAELSNEMADLKKKVPVELLVGQYQPLRQQSNDRWVGDVSAGGHDSLVVTPSTGLWYWNKRDEGGDIFSWLTKIEGKPWGEALHEIRSLAGSGVFSTATRGDSVAPEPKPITRPTREEVARYSRNLASSVKAQEWWKSRGLSDLDIEMWELGYIPDHWGKGPGGSMPVKWQGEYKTIRVRVWNPGEDATRYLPIRTGLGGWIFNGDLLFDETIDEIHIVEGEIKTMVLCRYAFMTIGIPGCTSVKAEWLPILAKKKKVFVILDPDPGLNPFAIKWVPKLAAMTEVRVVDCPQKPDDFLIRNPQKGVPALSAMISSARLVRSKNAKT